MDRKTKSAAGGVKKVRQKKEKALLADATKCAKITNLLKQSVGDDDDDTS